MDAMARKRFRDGGDDMDTSEDPPGDSENRCRVDGLQAAFFAEKGIVKDYARRWDPRMTEQGNAVNVVPFEEMDATISTWAVDLCNKTMGRELGADEERAHGVQSRAGKDSDWKEFKVPEPVTTMKP